MEMKSAFDEKTYKIPLEKTKKRIDFFKKYDILIIKQEDGEEHHATESFF